MVAYVVDVVLGGMALADRAELLGQLGLRLVQLLKGHAQSHGLSLL